MLSTRDAHARFIIDGPCSAECVAQFVKDDTCITPEARIFLYNGQVNFKKTYAKLKKKRPEIARELKESSIMIKYHGDAFAQKFNINLCEK